MRTIRVFLLLFAFACSGLLAAQPFDSIGHRLTFAQDSPGRTWPPDLVPISSDTSAKTPEASMDTFVLPPGYKVELVAAEPMIQDPIVMEFDADGRLWVIEVPSYMTELNPSNERERQPDGRVVVLEDVDDDGRMDTRRVFLDGLVLPRALKVLSDGVLIAEPPDLWFVPFNPDGSAGQKTRVAGSYGRRDAGIEHNENSLWWGFDNWLHTSEGTTHLRRKNGAFEVRRTLSRGQWGATHDDAGRVYRNTNESALFVDLVPTPYYARNPNLIRTRGSYESLAGRYRESDRVWPAHSTPAINRGYVYNVLGVQGELLHFTSVSAPVVFRGDRLPMDVYGNVFVVEPAANLVSRLVIDDSGPNPSARKAYEGAEFLVSTDERFRPVYLSPGPDGTLYILDMYRGIIQHRDYVTEYLRDQITARNLTLPVGHGRLYRVVHETIERGPRPRLAAESSARLVERLSHPNGWWRDTAHRILVERADASAVPALRVLARQQTDSRARLHALWILDGVDAIDVDTVRQALGASDRGIRIAAVRIAERWLGEANHPILTDVRARASDDDLAVRRQVAASIGALPEIHRTPIAAAMLARDGDDPVTVDATLSGLHGSEAAVLAQVLADATTRTTARETAVVMLTATIARSGDEMGMQRVFGWASDASRPEWQRGAVLGGMEVAWLGEPAPGPSPVRQLATPALPAPCPTCVGARGGPGGGSAFFPPAPAGGRGGRGGVAPIGIGREPDGLVTVAAGGGPLAERAARILGRLEWPGKPGIAVVAALTDEQQQRFERGRDVFKSLCIACHQADGQGADRLAPTLVGAELVLAEPGIAARILLNGKEGDIGLMPPLGQALSDEQIAAVLTYIRREWGNNASPVEPSVVRDARADTSSRTRPWTHDEIMALVP